MVDIAKLVYNVVEWIKRALFFSFVVIVATILFALAYEFEEMRALIVIIFVVLAGLATCLQEPQGSMWNSSSLRNYN